MHYYQHHIGDYRRDTAHLSLLEHGAYRQMLDTYYLSEKPFEGELNDIFRKLSARSQDEKSAVETILNEFFTLTEQGWTHKRCQLEIESYRMKADHSRANGMKGGRPKKQTETKEKNPEGTQEKPAGFSTETQVEPSQKLTINSETKEPETKEPESNEEDDFFSPAPVKRFRKPTMEEVEDYARLVGATRSDGQVMWDHWEAGGWKRGNQEIKCWKAAFRSWKRQGWLPSQKQAALDKPKIDWRNTL